MTILRRSLALVACLITTVLLAATVQSPTSARTVDDRCAGHGRIPASALRHGAVARLLAGRPHGVRRAGRGRRTAARGHRGR